MRIDPEQSHNAVTTADQDGKVSGKEGAQFLRKSGLKDSQLERIWDLVDQAKQGFLRPKEFAYAMRLIALAQAGKEPVLEEIKNVTSMKKWIQTE